jgi:hypothetical protein
MKRGLLSLILVFSCWGACFAQAVSSANLINNVKHYDGKQVSYRGEVVGEVMVRGDHAWANVLDGYNAGGIWIEKESAKGIVCAGSYKIKGDIVEVTGIFNRACLEHGGDLDIHAQTIEKIENGAPRIEHFSYARRNVVLILAGLLCLVLILTKLRTA